MPSGSIITVYTVNIDLLKEKQILTWKRHIKINKVGIDIHGYVCHDKNVDTIIDIDGFEKRNSR